MGLDRPIDVTTDQRKALLALLKRHLPNTTAWVYGSRVKWTSRPQSDLDLVVFTKPDQERRVSELREAFEESSLSFRVDLFVWDAVPKQFRKQIEAEHVVLVERENRGVREEWESVQLGEIVDLLAGFPFKSDRYVNYPKAPRLLRGDNIVQGTLRWDGAKRWPQEATDNLTPYWLREGDVVIAMDRPWIEAGLKFSSIRETDLPALLVQRVARLRGSGRLDTRFLNYVISCRDFTEYVLSVQTGTAVPHISAQQIKEFEFPLPPLPEQRAIAHVLGTLDDKIELNRRMNETLETMARALFKSWFVDFDPVRAKAALRNHSPLEGESARQGRSPQPSRWGEIDGETKWGAIKRFYSQQTLQKAQTLRESQTNAEGLLWHYLRDKQLAGHKFRRQQPIGPYIVDFACMPKKLLIELDGGQHAEQHTYDKKRDEFLRGKGYKILRFWNNDVFENCFGVLESIRAAVQDPPPQQSAPPKGLTTATPPQGGSDWSVERARAYLDRMPPNLADLFPDRLVDSELGPIPEGWEVKILGEHVTNFDSKRVPMSKAERAKRQGPFPYHGAAGVVDHVDDYLFDGIYFLVGEDGSVSREGGLAVTQYVWGKFWVNNHAHVLQGKGPVSTEQVYLYFDFEPVAPYVTGAVQPKLSQSRMNNMPFLFPGTAICRGFTKAVSPWFAGLRVCAAKSKTLAASRDTLLPKLISGKLRVKDAETFLDRVL